MKFSQSTFVIIALAVAFTSCEKQHLTAPVQPPVVPPVVSTIQTYFKFNGNLTDSTGNITTATPTGSIAYANDRNGTANSALYLDGASKVVFPGLVLKGKSMTMSAWIKYLTPGAGLQVILTAFSGVGAGPALVQLSNKLGLSVSTPSTNTATSNDVDGNWHHLATTYDGVDIKVYIDGVFSVTINHPGSMGDGARDMGVGFFSTNFWKGYIDELRIYNSVMTATDIQKLAAQ